MRQWLKPSKPAPARSPWIGPAQAWASIVACRLGDGLADSHMVALRVEYAQGEPVDMHLVAHNRQPGAAVIPCLASLRRRLRTEQAWQDGQGRAPGGLGAVVDVTRFPEARALLAEERSPAAVALLVAGAEDRRDGPQTMVAYSRLVSLLRLYVARGRLLVVPALADVVETALGALATKPAPQPAERVPVTDTEGPADLGLAVALAVRAAVLDRPLGPTEESDIRQRLVGYRRNNRIA